VGIRKLTAHAQLVRDRKLIRVLGSIQIVDELLVKLTVQRGSSGGHALHVERVDQRYKRIIKSRNTVL